MDYVFGKVKRKGVYIENLKTIGEQHSQLSDSIHIVREYPDAIITDDCRIVEHYKTAVDVEGRCYDWYIIEDHSREVDKLTPYKEIVDPMLAAIEAGIVEGVNSIVDDE